MPHLWERFPTCPMCVVLWIVDCVVDGVVDDFMDSVVDCIMDGGNFENI